MVFPFNKIKILIRRGSVRYFKISDFPPNSVASNLIIPLDQNIQVPLSPTYSRATLGVLSVIDYGTEMSYWTEREGEIDGGTRIIQYSKQIPYERVIFTCDTLELTWQENQNNISCIPKGTYNAQREEHSSKGKVIRINDVPGRTGILVHTGNSPNDTLGCVLVGELVNNQFKLMNSKTTMNSLWDKIGSGQITIEVE